MYFSQFFFPRFLCVGIALTGFSIPLWADTAPGSFTVNATVAKTCTVSATNLSFGNYTLTQLDATSTINVLCTKSTSYNIGLSAGSGASVNARAMTNGANSLNYSLSQDSTRSVNWGNTVGTDTKFVASAAGTTETHTVYGRIAASLGSAPVGTYTDTITITVTY